jgi:hypothetical protein
MEWITQTKQLNQRLREMPPLISGHLWHAYKHSLSAEIEDKSGNQLRDGADGSN